MHRAHWWAEIYWRLFTSLHRGWVVVSPEAFLLIETLQALPAVHCGMGGNAKPSSFGRRAVDEYRPVTGSMWKAIFVHFLMERINPQLVHPKLGVRGNVKRIIYVFLLQHTTPHNRCVCARCTMVGWSVGRFSESRELNCHWHVRRLWINYWHMSSCCSLFPSSSSFFSSSCLLDPLMDQFSFSVSTGHHGGRQHETMCTLSLVSS